MSFDMPGKSMKTYLTEVKATSNDEEELITIDNSVLTAGQFSTYFGDNARVLFNKQCQKTNRKNKIASLERPESACLRESLNKRSKENILNPSGTDSTLDGRSQFQLLKSPRENLEKTNQLPLIQSTSKSAESNRNRCSSAKTPRSVSPIVRRKNSFDYMRSRNIARSLIAGAPNDILTTDDVPNQSGKSGKLLSVSVDFCETYHNNTDSTINSSDDSSISNDTTEDDENVPTTLLCARLKLNIDSDDDTEEDSMTSLNSKEEYQERRADRQHNRWYSKSGKRKQENGDESGNNGDESREGNREREREREERKGKEKDRYIRENSKNEIIYNFKADLGPDEFLENDIEKIPLTPRTRFISACIKEGLNPRASMVNYGTLIKVFDKNK